MFNVLGTIHTVTGLHPETCHTVTSTYALLIQTAIRHRQKSV